MVVCMSCFSVIIVFFFVKQKTAYEMRISDWSSDVCSSDLGHTPERCCAGEAVPSAAPGAPAAGPASQRSGPGILSAGGSRMSAPHPLNQAVIAQALHDLRNGQLRRCKALGFGEAERDALNTPDLVRMMVKDTVSCVSGLVTSEVLKRPLPQVTTWEGENALCDLRNG